jgi:RNA polymerase sigma factor (TIGR02999 family)
MSETGDITALLLQLDGTGANVLDRIFPLVYDELRAIAQARLRAERADHTLSATALVHEAYLRLVDQQRVDWKNRAHFFAIAARAMRRILIDHAVARKAAKRGGGAALITLGDDSASRESNVEELLAIEGALTRLGALDQRQERVVELRFFAGMKLEEIAEVMQVSLASVNRDWRTARAFLTAELRD